MTAGMNITLRNSINLELKWLTSPNFRISNVKKFNPTDIFKDSTNLKEYLFTDQLGVETGKKIKIKGQPSLNQFSFL